jgi:beta-glucanase (GH16 family)
MSEEFNGAVSVVNADTGLVRFRTGGPSWATWYPDWPRFNAQSPGGNHTNTDEACYYATSKVSLAGGAAVLACDKVQTVGGLPYTAGMIQSLDFYTPETGYFEARIKLETIVNGTWPAFWASCSTFDQWPPEIDFWEQFGSAPTYESHVYLSGSAYHDTGNAATMTSYQTYGCLWTPSAVTFYLNGSQTGTTSAQVPSDPLYVILKNGARAPANPTFNSCDLSVDYVRCWALP